MNDWSASNFHSMSSDVEQPLLNKNGTGWLRYYYDVSFDRRPHVKAKMSAISSDTHQLQSIKLHHFKLDRFKLSSDLVVVN